MTYKKLRLTHKKTVRGHRWTKVSFVTDNPNYEGIRNDPGSSNHGTWNIPHLPPFDGTLMHTVRLSEASMNAMNLEAPDWWSVTIAAVRGWLTLGLSSSWPPSVDPSDDPRVQFWTSADSYHKIDLHSLRAQQENIPRDLAIAKYIADFTYTELPGYAGVKSRLSQEDAKVDKKKPYVLVIGGRMQSVPYTLKEAQDAAAKHVQSFDNTEVVIFKAVSRVRRQLPKVEVVGI